MEAHIFDLSTPEVKASRSPKFQASYGDIVMPYLNKGLESCSCIGLGLGSKHPRGGSQPSVTGSDALSSGVSEDSYGVLK